MRALQLIEDRRLETVEVAPPPAPGLGEVTLRIKAVALNHIDVWGWRGMAFAKRKLPLTIGAEASGEVEAVGAGVSNLMPGQLVAIYGARTCGLCRNCREGRDNLCEHVSGVHGFHLDGFAQEKINLPARLLVPAPPGVGEIGAAVTPVTYGTVEHMLFDNAKLEPGETILVHAGGSGIGTAAIQLAKKTGCTVITTVGSNDKMEHLSLSTVFGDRIRKIPVSSNKSMIGHTLSAAGAVEAAFSLMTMREGVIPPTINYDNPDPAIDLDVVPNVKRSADVSSVLSNSFGFGGQNTCLVLAREPV